MANFKDYRFLQVFYPTRGILSWYSRQTGVLRPLPGADDPRFVQMGAVWSPDGQYLVFARAEATDPNPPGVPLAKFANDPNELQIQYDLYRIPFHDGEGGAPEPIAGASRNGMSNTFPKVSPDGRWIVFVRMPQRAADASRQPVVHRSGGGRRRRGACACNTPRMNSWHSFSPNGRWLVFSSKSRSPYTQMYLTHIDADGNDSPPILIENATAANRAVNIPEFVNVPPDGLRQIGGPVIDYYRLVNSAAYLQRTGSYEASAAKWRKVLELSPDDEIAHRNLGTVLLMTGHREESAAHFRKASEIKLRAALEADPTSARGFNDLGVLLVADGAGGGSRGAIRESGRAEAGFRRGARQPGRRAGEAGEAGRGARSTAQSAGVGRRVCARALQSGAGFEPAGGCAGRHPGMAERAGARPEIRGGPRSAWATRWMRKGGRRRPWRTGATVSELQPNDAPALRRAAWVLATSPDATIRNGGEALAFAVRAVELSGGKDARMLDTLAAAYAEKGQFADAALTARRAQARAAQENQPALADEISDQDRVVRSGSAVSRPAVVMQDLPKARKLY